ncbi:methyltransferase [Streptomyces sp. NPDC056361]|uniref:methyltransferase n=1 Tax=Streptomyces sp. NPDC056361 TaxID=3345795 RepID=UPI0035DDB41E
MSTEVRQEMTDGEMGAPVRWYSANGTPRPERVVSVPDTVSVAAGHRMMTQGSAVLWSGDYPSALRLLAAPGRRTEPNHRPLAETPAEAFERHRRDQARRARLLGRLLIPYGADWAIALRRAHRVREACVHTYGPCAGPGVGSLRELLGVIGAYEWHSKSVEIPALGGDRIHPHYGVFSPVRGEYVDLVADAELPRGHTAFDIGTGTGVLSSVLARRGLRHVVATDQDARAVRCARDNAARHGLTTRIAVRQADLFPEGRADLIVCNPPWLPGQP